MQSAGKPRGKLFSRIKIRAILASRCAGSPESVSAMFSALGRARQCMRLSRRTQGGHALSWAESDPDSSIPHRTAESGLTGMRKDGARTVGSADKRTRGHAQ